MSAANNAADGTTDKKKDQTSPIKDRGKPENGSPARFDSAPARVRFDSQPSAKRFDSPPSRIRFDSAPSKATSQKEPSKQVEQTAKDKTSNSEKIVTTPVNKDSAKNNDNKASYTNSAMSKSPNSTKISATSESESSKTNESVIDKSDTKTLKVVEKENQKSKPDSSKDKDCNLKHVDKKSNLAEDSASLHSVHSKIESTKSAVVKSTKVVQSTAAKETITVVNDEIGSRSNDKEKSTESSRQTKLTSEVKGSGFADSDGTKSSKPSSSTNRDSEEMEPSVPKEIEASPPTEREASALAEDKASDMAEKRASDSARKQSNASAEELTSKVTRKQASESGEKQASEPEEKEAAESAKKEDSQPAEVTAVKTKVVLFAGHKKAESDAACEPTSAKPKVVLFTGHKKPESEVNSETPSAKPKVVLFTGHKKPESESTSEPTVAKPKVVLYTGHKKPDSDASVEPSVVKPKVVLFTGHKKPEVPTTAEPTGAKPKVVLFTGHKRPESDGSVESPAGKPKVVLFTGHKKPESETRAEPAAARPKVVLFTGHKRPPTSVPKTADTQLLRDIKVEVGAQKRLLEEANSGDEGSSNAKKKRTGGVIEESSRPPSEDSEADSVLKITECVSISLDDGDKMDTSDGVKNTSADDSSKDGIDADKDSGLPCIAISDIRSVSEDGAPRVVALDEDQGKSNDSDKTDKGDSSGKGKGINAIANKLVKERSDDKKDPSAPGAKKASNDTEAEIKTYATDTMNELLGLFGYDKMDESVRDELKLKSSISGNKDKIGDADVKEEVGENVTEGTSATSEGKKDEKDKAKELAAKEKDPEGGRTCTECNQVKKTCKFQVLMHESTRFLCDDNCFKAFRSRQKLTTSVTSTPENRPQTRSVTAPKDFCQLCSREIKNGQGFLPGVGENKPLCSEECTRKYQMTHAPKRACAQCGSAILGRNKCLTWETMEYCNEDCLGKYQSYLGSHCACCNNAVQRTSLGKYCVRFGSDIKQFCSNNCLEEFKKGLKVCSFCQKDISSGTEGFLAPVGDKGQFKDFCSQQCMEKYETMNNSSKNQPAIHQCSVCNKMAAIKVQVMFEGKSHKLCSEPCIAAFRYANKINTSICDTCHKFFDVDVANPHTIQHEGLSKRFCAKTCMNIFVLSHRKIVPCTWCKVKKYNFDMIERVDSNNSVQLFCSLNCLSLFRVSLNATSSRSVRCDFCHHSRPAQYHLTMSDASIRNFCSYPCVMSFQGQFTNVTPVTPSPPVPQQSSTGTSTQVSSNHTSTPVISSVMSLAPQQQQQQHLQQQHVAQQQPAPIQKPVASTRHYGGPRKPPPVVITPSPPAVQSAPLATAAPTASASTQVAQQVIIKPPLPKQLKNKALLCKPFMQTKGVSCKPHPCHKSVQTDDTIGKSVIIPVPIPIYVPTPMHMYVSPVPVPIPFPLPLPVPVFIPTTKTTSESILKQIKDIREKIPTNPFEAELLMMAEMVAGAEKNGKKGRRGDRDDDRDEDDQDDDRDYDGMDDGFDDRDDDKDDEKDDGKDENSIISGDQNREKDSDSDTDTRRSSIVGDNNNSKENPAVTLTRRPSKRQRDADSSNADENTNDVVSPRSLRARSRKAPKPTRKENKGSGSKKGRGRGRKKARLEDAEPDTPPASVAPISDSNLVLKFTYGVNAWKHWVLQKNTQLEKASQSNRKLKLFKTDLLQLTADELNYSLCLFVKEVRKPNGDEYAPDSIFYLCLGIQQYLFESSRIDNIFTDAYYEKFTECLNEVLQRYDLAVAAEGCMLSRIEEEILWESKQLGAHSPHVLLNTLMYFNTKFFMLKTIDDHLRLSFSHVMKHWKKAPGSSGGGGRGGSSACVTGTPGRNVLLRYCPPPPQRGETGRKRKDDQPVFEQIENQDNPLRCPVKLYEFYLSKCPESIKNRSDVFYLYPERSCVPDSPVWYSTMPLGREAVSKMLQRIKMVREVSDILMPDS